MNTENLGRLAGRLCCVTFFAWLMTACGSQAQSGDDSLWRPAMTADHFGHLIGAEGLSEHLQGTYKSAAVSVVLRLLANGGLLVGELLEGTNEGFIAFADPERGADATEIERLADRQNCTDHPRNPG